MENTFFFVFFLNYFFIFFCRLACPELWVRRGEADLMVSSVTHSCVLSCLSCLCVIICWQSKTNCVHYRLTSKGQRLKLCIKLFSLARKPHEKGRLLDFGTPYLSILFAAHSIYLHFFHFLVPLPASSKHFIKSRFIYFSSGNIFWNVTIQLLSIHWAWMHGKQWKVTSQMSKTTFNVKNDISETVHKTLFSLLSLSFCIYSSTLSDMAHD